MRKGIEVIILKTYYSGEFNVTNVIETPIAIAIISFSIDHIA